MYSSFYEPDSLVRSRLGQDRNKTWPNISSSQQWKLTIRTTDASDAAWCGVVTQLTKCGLSVLYIKQQQGPISFLWDHLTKSQSGWPTIEMDTNIIMAAIPRMHWLLQTSDVFDLHTDHQNRVLISTLLQSCRISCKYPNGKSFWLGCFSRHVQLNLN